METIISLFIVFGIPAIFLILWIKNIVEIIKLKKAKITVKKSLIIKSMIFGIIFISIVIFYMRILYLLSKIPANM